MVGHEVRVDVAGLPAQALRFLVVSGRVVALPSSRHQVQLRPVMLACKVQTSLSFAADLQPVLIILLHGECVFLAIYFLIQPCNRLWEVIWHSNL